MEMRSLTVENRSETGSSAVSRLRRSGFIPGVVYGSDGVATTVVMNRTDYRRSVAGAGSTQLFQFKSGDKALDGAMALIKDIQMEPIKEEVLHVDFLRLSKDHRITVSVPVEVVGEAPAVKLEDCILNQSVHEVEIECLPLEIPSVLQIDVSGLHAGESLHASDLKLPANVRLRSDESLALVSAIHKKDDEPAKAAAPEAAAPAAGAAAAAGGKAPAAAAKAPAKDDKKK